jgi:2-oxoglutarate ferredoxin oxidoreductase subunit beta
MIDPQDKKHPVEPFFDTEALPSVWCSGCGIGTVIYTFIQTVNDLELNPEQIEIVSGAGCTSKIAEYSKFPSHRVPDGTVFRVGADRSINQTGSRTVVFSNNTDLLISGAKDFIEIKRQCSDLLVVHINNFFYVVSEKGFIPATPLIRKSTDDYVELPFNIPLLAQAGGASYIARWTPYHAGWLRYAFLDTINAPGISVIEVISPCLLYDANTHRMGDPVDRMKFYNDHSGMRYGGLFTNLDLRGSRQIIIGTFLNQ